MQQEVYPNAPLRLVTAEFRFPLSTILSRQDTLNSLSELFSNDFPIIEPTPPGIELNSGSASEPGTIKHPGYRFINRDRKSSVTIIPNRVTIETTEYGHWEDFRKIFVEPAMKIVGDNLNAIPGLERIGLRYLNEVRVPKISSMKADKWSKYINSDLVAVKSLAEAGSLETIQSLVHIKIDKSMDLVLRTGTGSGHLVDDSGPLRLSSPVLNGPFFFIDIDSFWTNTGILNEWDLKNTVSLINKLHEPIDDMFENCITDELKNEVLRRKN